MPQRSETEAWFKSWFNTPYYHQLYAHRDDNEARFFIQNVLEKLEVTSKCKLLDLACGRGRHALFLNELGYQVTGIDLSERNIEYALDQVELKDRLSFEVGDMRQNFGEARFDYIFNLFTSFGYFESKVDNLKACESIRKALKPHGMLIMDFMNVNKVKLGLVKEEVKNIEGIEFHIQRIIRDQKVIKKISFEDKGKDFQFEEHVQLLELKDFEELFDKAGMKIENTYGDFNLEPFNFTNSERLILFASAKP